MIGSGEEPRGGGLLGRVLGHPSAALVGSSGLSMVLGLGTAALQARLLGPAGRGELAIAMVPGGLIAILLSFGLPDFAARLAARGTRTRVLSSLAAVVGLAVGIVAFVPYVALARFQAPQGSDAWWLLVIWAAVVPLYIYGSTLTGAAIGGGRWLTSAGVRALPGLVALLVLTLLFLSGEEVSPLVVGSVLIATTVLTPLVYLVDRANWPQRTLDRTIIRDAARFGLRGWLASATALVNQRIDLLLVSTIARPQEIGLYAVSTTLAATLNAVANAIAMPNRNRVARGEVEGVAKTCAATMLLILVLAIVLAALVPFLISVFLGRAFAEAATPMLVLLAAQVPLAGVVVLTQSLNGAGLPGKPLVGEIVALATTAVLITTFFGHGGLVLAAVATGVGNLLSLAVLVWLCRKHLHRSAVHQFVFINPRELATVVRSLK